MIATLETPPESTENASWSAGEMGNWASPNYSPQRKAARQTSPSAIEKGRRGWHYVADGCNKTRNGQLPEVWSRAKRVDPYQLLLGRAPRRPVDRPDQTRLLVDDE